MRRTTLLALIALALGTAAPAAGERLDQPPDQARLRISAQPFEVFDRYVAILGELTLVNRRSLHWRTSLAVRRDGRVLFSEAGRWRLRRPSTDLTDTLDERLVVGYEELVEACGASGRSCTVAPRVLVCTRPVKRFSSRLCRRVAGTSPRRLVLADADTDPPEILARPPAAP